MSSISLPLISRKKDGNLRQVNILRDLPKIADLVELCFHNIDREGKRYVEQMRHAGENRRRLQWTNADMPLLGYVWEQDGQIVGNISIVPFPKRHFLLANIAVHPDYRQRGIARKLTARGIAFAHERGSNNIWLHVEKDNEIAIHLYRSLGFQGKALRTTWDAATAVPASLSLKNHQITTQVGRYWSQHNIWLEHAYPPSLRWYRMPNFQILAPGIKNWLYRIFVEHDIRQWALTQNGMPQALLSWIPTYTLRSPLWLAAAPGVDAAALATLLQRARKELGTRKSDLYIDYPARQNAEAFRQAGFNPRRTLLWMYASGRH